MSIPVTWVDAFSDVVGAGNPAAVCLLHEPLHGLEALTFLLIWLGLAIYSFPLKPRTASG